MILNLLSTGKYEWFINTEKTENNQEYILPSHKCSLLRWSHRIQPRVVQLTACRVQCSPHVLPPCHTCFQLGLLVHYPMSRSWSGSPWKKDKQKGLNQKNLLKNFRGKKDLGLWLNKVKCFDEMDPIQKNIYFVTGKSNKCGFVTKLIIQQ